MNEPKWILEDAAKAIHSMLLSEHGGGAGVRDIALLESALNRAPQKFAYDTKTTVFELAAAYSFRIAKNHPFVDGNKRTAFMAGVIFLEINEYKFIAPETESKTQNKQRSNCPLDEFVICTFAQLLAC